MTAEEHGRRPRVRTILGGVLLFGGGTSFALQLMGLNDFVAHAANGAQAIQGAPPLFGSAIAAAIGAALIVGDERRVAAERRQRVYRQRVRERNLATAEARAFHGPMAHAGSPRPSSVSARVWSL